MSGKVRALYFHHAGWNPGYHSEVVYFPALRQGAAVMVNGDARGLLDASFLYICRHFIYEMAS